MIAGRDGRIRAFNLRTVWLKTRLETGGLFALPLALLTVFLPKPPKKKLMRLRQLKALETAAGAWKDKDHPELKHGSAKWVARLRRQDEKRFKKTTVR